MRTNVVSVTGNPSNSIVRSKQACALSWLKCPRRYHFDWKPEDSLITLVEPTLQNFATTRQQLNVVRLPRIRFAALGLAQRTIHIQQQAFMDQRLVDLRRMNGISSTAEKPSSSAGGSKLSSHRCMATEAGKFGSVLASSFKSSGQHALVTQVHAHGYVVAASAADVARLSTTDRQAVPMSGRDDCFARDARWVRIVQHHAPRALIEQTIAAGESSHPACPPTGRD